MVGKWQQTTTLAQQRTQHEASLRQQREELEKTLDQQREQHAQMLSHERHRDDLSEVRAMLDDAARALNNADHRRRDIIGDIENETKRRALGEAGLGLDELKLRVALRFGREHEVTRTWEACADALLEVFGATQFPELFELSDRSARLRVAGEAFEQRQPAFIDAATAHAGVDLAARA